MSLHQEVERRASPPGQTLPSRQSQSRRSAPTLYQQLLAKTRCSTHFHLRP